MSVRLFVSNLPYDATEADLREYFSAIGAISFLSLPTDRETGRPRGFAFVEFNDRAQAEEAIRRYNNQLFMGRPMVVNEARPREDRPSSSASSRPAFARPDASLDHLPPDAAAPGAKPTRNFGPDAAPRRNRGKGKANTKSERGPKGPMRERVTGQFFSGDTGDDEDDDFSSQGWRDHNRDQNNDWEEESND